MCIFLCVLFFFFNFYFLLLLVLPRHQRAIFSLALLIPWGMARGQQQPRLLLPDKAHAPCGDPTRPQIEAAVPLVLVLGVLGRALGSVRAASGLLRRCRVSAPSGAGGEGGLSRLSPRPGPHCWASQDGLCGRDPSAQLCRSPASLSAAPCMEPGRPAAQ